MAMRNEALLKRLAELTAEYEKVAKEYEDAWANYVSAAYWCEHQELTCDYELDEAEKYHTKRYGPKPPAVAAE